MGTQMNMCVCVIEQFLKNPWGVVKIDKWLHIEIDGIFFSLSLSFFHCCCCTYATTHTHKSTYFILHIWIPRYYRSLYTKKKSKIYNAFYILYECIYIPTHKAKVNKENEKQFVFLCKTKPPQQQRMKV